MPYRAWLGHESQCVHTKYGLRKTSVLLHFIATSLASSGRFRNLTMFEDAEVLATGYGYLYDLDISQCQLVRQNQHHLRHA